MLNLIQSIEQFNKEHLDLIHSLLELGGCVGTIGAVITSLYLANKQNKLKAEAQVDVKILFKADTSYLGEKIAISIVNREPYPIYIPTVWSFHWLSSFMGFKWPQTFMTVIPEFPDFNDKDEIEILPQKEFSFLFSVDLIQTLRKNFLSKYYLLRFIDVCLLKTVIRTDCNRLIRAKLGPELRSRLQQK